MMGQDTDSSRASTITLIMAFVIAGIFFITDRGSERLLTQTTIGAESGIAPALALLSAPIRALENISTGLQDRSRAVEENKVLREELYALREEKQRAQIMELKLERFEEILGADSGIDIPTKKIAARAVSEINGPFVRSALINAGLNKGIEKGHPVMTVHGLYGHNSDLPLLAFVEDRADWREGDKVLSSGDGGVLPQGLPIGEVKANKAGQFVVTLGTTGKPTDWVWVYPYDPAEAPEAVIDVQAESDADNVGETSAEIAEAGAP